MPSCRRRATRYLAEHSRHRDRRPSLRLLSIENSSIARLRSQSQQRLYAGAAQRASADSSTTSWSIPRSSQGVRSIFDCSHRDNRCRVVPSRRASSVWLRPAARLRTRKWLRKKVLIQIAPIATFLVGQNPSGTASDTAKMAYRRRKAHEISSLCTALCTS